MKSFILLLFCSFLSCWSQAQENEYIRFNSNKIDINRNGIHVKNCSFALHLLIGGGQPLTLYPSGPPNIKITTRQTPTGIGIETSYNWVDTRGYQYSWLITKIGDNILSFRANFVNGSLEPVFLQKFELLSTPDNDFSVEGNASEWMLSSTNVESRRWGTMDKEIPSESELQAEEANLSRYLILSGDSTKFTNRAWRGFYDDLSLYKEPGKSGITFAAVDSISDIYYNIKVTQTKMKLEVWGDMSEILVEPGESRTSDEILLLFSPWDEAQSTKNKWIADISNAKVTKKPIFGWCSWYRVGNKVTQDDILDIASYTRKNRTKIPFDVIQIDDGWQVGKFNWTENEKFNRGFEELVDSVKDAGAVAGIWLSPDKVDPVIAETKQTSRPFPKQWYTEYRLGKSSMDRLDPTHPEVRKFIYNSLQNCYNLGFRYFKLDFSEIPYYTRRFYNPKLTRFQAQRELFRIFRGAVGNESYLLACGSSNLRSKVPYVDAVRIGTDTAADDGFVRDLASDGQPRLIYGFWYPIVSIVNQSFENGILSNGDPDVTDTGQVRKCRPAQLQTFHSFVGIYGGAAMVSDRLFENKFDNQDYRRMLEILYPVSKEKGHPFAGGWDMYGKEFGYIAKTQYGNFVNLILWNPEHQGTANLTMKNVPISELGHKFHAWSFWEEKYIGIIDNNYVATQIPFYEHQLLKLTPLASHPVLIGSNLHISMGTTEVQNISYTNSQVVIEMKSNAGSRDGRLYFYSEKQLSNVKSTNSDSFIIRQNKNIYVLILTGRIRDKKELITIEIGGKTPVLQEKELCGSLLEKYYQSSFTPAWKGSW